MSAEDERIATEKLLEVIRGKRSPQEKEYSGPSRAIPALEKERGFAAESPMGASSRTRPGETRDQRSEQTEQTLEEIKEATKNSALGGSLIPRKRQWRIFRARREKAVLGLDIGFHSIKYVLQKQTTDGPVLQDFGMQSLPPVSEDVLARGEDIYAAAIRQLIKDRGIQADSVMVAASGPQVAIRRILISRVPSRELRESIFWAVRKEIPFSSEQFQFDYNIIEDAAHDARKLDALVAAAESPLVYRISRIMKKAALRLDGITPASMAMWNLQKAISVASGEHPAVFIDIGHRAATFAFFHSGALMFTREVFTAGQPVSASIAGPTDTRHILVREREKERSPMAEDAPEDHFLPQVKDPHKSDEMSAPKSLNSQSPALRRLINEINRSLDYCQSLYPDAPLEPIYISGGMACIEGFDRLLAEGLSLDVRRLDPFSFIRRGAVLSSARPSEEMFPLYGIAVGLALDNGRGVNLLPHEQHSRTEMALAQFVLPVGVATAAFALLMAALFGYYTAIAGRDLKTVSMIQVNQENLAKMVLVETKNLAEHEERLAFNRRVLSYMNYRSSRAPAVMKEISLITPEEIILDSLIIDKKKNQAPSGASSSMEGYRFSLEIKGGVFGNPSMQGSALARFMRALDESPFFKFPRILSQSMEKESGTVRLSFSLECQMEVETR